MAPRTTPGGSSDSDPQPRRRRAAAQPTPEGVHVKLDNAELSDEEKKALDEERKDATGNLQGKAPVETKSERRVRLMLEGTSPQAKHHPTVRGGICDFCGIIDPKKPSEVQYLLCPHYRDLAEQESVPGYKGLRCSYCPMGLNAANLTDILLHRIFQVYELLEKPGELIVCCDDLRCRDKHIRRFTTAA